MRWCAERTLRDSTDPAECRKTSMAPPQYGAICQVSRVDPHSTHCSVIKGSILGTRHRTAFTQSTETEDPLQWAHIRLLRQPPPHAKCTCRQQAESNQIMTRNLSGIPINAKAAILVSITIWIITFKAWYHKVDCKRSHGNVYQTPPQDALVDNRLAASEFSSLSKVTGQPAQVFTTIDLLIGHVVESESFDVLTRDQTFNVRVRNRA